MDFGETEARSVRVNGMRQCREGIKLVIYASAEMIESSVLAGQLNYQMEAELNLSNKKKG
ncbi:hypothetical protein C5167_005926 [Papaver somniferum]|uniref:Uncharacterized protein n=1 Tax=Papaver somniferum TaxID=3469 RepID=A0A4Y7JF39_PAPSO|nr:hypothetical protein C5167_005926 [Papaver somniferum]